MKDIYIDNDKKFYSQLKKYVKKKNYIVHLNLDDKDIINDNVLKKENFDEDLKFKIQCVHAVNIKSIKKRYSYIYDTVCDYLDEKFIENDICQFKDNVCIGVKNKSHCAESKNGCCYGSKRGLCKNFVNGKCKVKSISCKLFTCGYLKKHNVKFKINDIPLLKYFFNFKQKFIIWEKIFVDKPEMIKLLIDNK